MTSQTVRRPARRRTAARKALLVLGIMLALCCLGATSIVVVVGYDIHRAPQAEAQIRGFGETLAADLQDAEFAALYLLLSAAAQERCSAEDFAKALAERPTPRSHTIEHVSAWLWLSYVTISFVYADGHGETHTFDLVEEGDVWRVSSDLLADLASGPRHGGGGHHHH